MTANRCLRSWGRSHFGPGQLRPASAQVRCGNTAQSRDRHARDNSRTASEDAASVYREILRTYKPKNVDIFGCSAGRLLTAETVAWLQKELLSLPGGVGVFCSGASYWSDGDSGYLAKAIAETGPMTGISSKNPYFRNTDPDDVLAFPVRSTSIMSKFPPTLIIASRRDIAPSLGLPGVARGIRCDG